MHKGVIFPYLGESVVSICMCVRVLVCSIPSRSRDVSVYPCMVDLLRCGTMLWYGQVPTVIDFSYIHMSH